MTVTTRFAPSPTGMLHLGGARTALFNYLFAKRHGGTFLLRVEDTDAARSTDEAKQAILDGMNWLGLHADGEIVYQSAQVNRHKEVAEQLLKEGKAYYCYASAEELAAMREQAQAEGKSFQYDRRWRDAADKGLTPPEGVAPSIRIKAPINESITVDDAVQGSVNFTPDALDDFVILRSDDTPTYMLAVVVDDHDMGITHVIRGDDHFNNAARQAVIYQAMGWELPKFAHIPLIHGSDGAKLSKRHGATAIGEYEHLGFLPEAMRNYLLRLGWSHGDDEIISDEQAAQWFDLESIGKAPAQFDVEKLKHLNSHYLRLKSDEELAALILPYTKLEQAQLDMLACAIATVKERAGTLHELVEAVAFYFDAPASYDDKAQQQLSKHADNLGLIIPAFEALDEPWNTEQIKQAIKDTADSTEKKMGAFMPPIRAAIVGAMQGPDMGDALCVLGKHEAIARLKAALEKTATLAA